MLPPLAVSFCQPVEADAFFEFAALFAEAGALVEIEERDPPGPQAGLEWLLPTAVIVFIGKAYFDGFFKEMGKEHYALLKKGLQSLHKRLVGPKAPVVTILSSVGKRRATDDYSLLFSLLAEADDGLRFKLLIQQAASEEVYQATVEAFLDFLDAFHAKSLPSTMLNELRSVRVVGRTILLAYEPERKGITVVDPLAPMQGRTDE